VPAEDDASGEISSVLVNSQIASPISHSMWGVVTVRRRRRPQSITHARIAARPSTLVIGMPVRFR